LLEGIGLATFDLDGTLIDSAPDLAGSINYMLGRLGGTPLAAVRVHALIGDGIEALVARAWRESFGVLTQAPPAQALALFREHYRQHLFEASCVYPGVVETLRALENRGVRLACVTNKELALAGALLEQAGLMRWLEFSLSPVHHSERKPSAHLLLCAAQKARVGPQRLLHVGDTRADILAARAAGCRVVATTLGYQGAAELAALRPDALIGCLNELLRL
jgi:phosphoglycolate phosphatase